MKNIFSMYFLMFFVFCFLIWWQWDFLAENIFTLFLEKKY